MPTGSNPRESATETILSTRGGQAPPKAEKGEKLADHGFRPSVTGRRGKPCLQQEQTYLIDQLPALDQKSLSQR